MILGIKVFACILYTTCMQYLHRPEEGRRSPGTGVTVASCHWVLRTKPRSFEKAVNDL